MRLIEGPQYASFKRKYNPDFVEAEDVLYAEVELLSSNQKVLLNLGCGSQSCLGGLYSSFAKVIGLDQDEEVLAKHPGLTERLASSAEKIPLPSGSVDVVVAEWVLEHLKQPKVVLGEISRILKEGGTFVFLTPNRGNPIVFTGFLFSSFGGGPFLRLLVRLITRRRESEVFSVFYRLNSPSRLRDLGSQAGLRLLALEDVGGASGYLRFSRFLLWLALKWEKLSKDWPRGWRFYLVGRFVK